MSKDDFSALGAGREMDAAVAGQVFGRTARVYRGEFGETLYLVADSAQRTGANGTSANLIGGSWEKGYDGSGELIEFYGRICPAFSSDIAAAWGVVEKLKALSSLPDGRACDLCVKVGVGDGFFVEVFDLSPMGYVNTDKSTQPPLEYFTVGAETAPLAICKAALKVFAK